MWHDGVDNKMQAIAFKCISFCNKKKLKRWFEKAEKKASQLTEQRTKTQFRIHSTGAFNSQRMQ